MPLFIFRSNDYTEFNTCTGCNHVVTDSYDSLYTTAIGMCVDGLLCIQTISYLTTQIMLYIYQTVLSKYELSELVRVYLKARSLHIIPRKFSYFIILNYFIKRLFLFKNIILLKFL